MRLKNILNDLPARIRENYHAQAEEDYYNEELADLNQQLEDKIDNFGLPGQRDPEEVLKEIYTVHAFWDGERCPISSDENQSDADETDE